MLFERLLVDVGARSARDWCRLAGPLLCLALAACGGRDAPAPGTDATPAAKAALARLAPHALVSAAVSPAAADTAGITPAQLMDWAQTALPEVFPGPATTLADKAFVYRVYARTGNLLAVMDDGRVFVVLAGASASPRYMGLLESYACPVAGICGQGSISLLSGSAGGPGNLDGQGSAARFNGPLGLALDKDGQLWVADSANYALRKVQTDGKVSTLALPAFDNPALSSGYRTIRLSPVGVAADPLSGSVYVSANTCILKVSPQGVITVHAGSPIEIGARDGTGGDARFYGASGLAIDGQGNLFVADSSNHLVRKITPGGQVTSVAGAAGVSGSADGASPAQARMAWPTALAVGGDGVLYALDQNGVRKISPEGSVSTWLKASRQANGAAWAYALTVDGDGTAYLTRSGQATVDKVSPDGQITVLAGQPQQRGTADGPGGDARFIAPAGIALDRQGNLYVTDTQAYEQTALGGLTREAHTVRRISPQGQVTTLAGAPLDTGWRDGIGAEALFNMPRGMAVGADGMLYVADTYNAVVRRVSPAGEVSTIAGGPRQAGTQDGQGTNARFSLPTGVAVDSTGTLYVTDAERYDLPTGPGFPTGIANTVRKITVNGAVSTLAGTPGVAGDADGAGPAASFHAPWGIAVDTTGHVYVADMANQAVRKITPAGQVSTVIRSPKFTFDPFLAPMGVGVDGTGNLYAIDAYHHVIKRGVDGRLWRLAPPWTTNPIDIMGLDALTGLAVDTDGTLYVADFPEGVSYVAGAAAPAAMPISNVSNTGHVWRVTPDGRLDRIAGITEGTAVGNKLGPLPGVLDQVQAVASDGHGTLYVAVRGGILKLKLR